MTAARRGAMAAMGEHTRRDARRGDAKSETAVRRHRADCEQKKRKMASPLCLTFRGVRLPSTRSLSLSLSLTD